MKKQKPEKSKTKTFETLPEPRIPSLPTDLCTILVYLQITANNIIINKIQSLKKTSVDVASYSQSLSALSQFIYL